MASGAPGKRDERWLNAKLKLEEELGPIVPSGAQGGAEPRSTRRRSAALRARERVRLTYQALDEAA